MISTPKLFTLLALSSCILECCHGFVPTISTMFNRDKLNQLSTRQRLFPNNNWVTTKSKLVLYSTTEDDNNLNDDDMNAVGAEKKEVKSYAKEWAMKQKRQYRNDNDRKQKYVIVGGGWGGWGAAKTLCESNVECDVILIDSLPDPTGKTPYLSKTGKPVEAGTRGFWKDYPNINSLCDQLGLDQNDIFTPFTNSSFYSPDGLEATAPVFSETKIKSIFPFIPGDQSFPQLPSPLGQVLATFPLFERIPLADRASMVGLLLATVDCLGADESVQEQYDRMTAHELFIRFGLSKRLVDDFIRPTLLVGLFKPPEELSALVVMELLYYYALAHQDSFDVRWIKKGTVSDSLIAPLASMLQTKHNLQVLGGCTVGEITVIDDGKQKLVTEVAYTDRNGVKSVIDDVDGVILALGCKGMANVVRASPSLASIPTFSKAASLNGIDVISTRIWFDKVVPTRTPANVFSRFKELRGAGGTFFMLDQLQGNTDELWGVSSEGVSDSDDEVPRGSVVACDFYNAGALLTMSDDDIIKVLTDKLLPSAVPEFADARVVDSWVGKYPGTVSWFSPGSFSSRPPLEGAGNNVLPNLKVAGDWIRMGDNEHGAKGLCQERAYVTGIEAANSLLSTKNNHKSAKVLPVREDEIQFKVSLSLNRSVMKYLPRFWVR